MAFALELSSLDNDTKKDIIRELSVKENKSRYSDKAKLYHVFNTNKSEDAVYLPLRQYSRYLDKFPHNPKDYSKMNVKFIYDLYTKETDPTGRCRDQDIVVEESLAQLKKSHSVFISCFTGFGKSMTGVYLSCFLGYKTMIVVHLSPLKGQWKDEITKFTGGKAKIQILEGNKPLDPRADFYIVGVQKAAKFPRDDLLDIGTVIIDEAHICTVAAFTKSILKFQPMYVIGLSATPERADGLQKLLTKHFGPQKDFIKREEVKKFTVIKYKTNYCPEISYQQVNGENVLAWVKMLSNLATIKKRWVEIAEIAISEPKHKIILLCDRQDMATNIYEYLTEKGESAELLIGNKKTWDKTKRILIAGVKKGGVGLNDPSLTMLILAADMKNVKQCEGRIRTTDNIVYDVVDDFRTFENHWNLREKWYRKRGASIVYKNSDPPKEGDGKVKKRYLKPKTS